MLLATYMGETMPRWWVALDDGLMSFIDPVSGDGANARFLTPYRADFIRDVGDKEAIVAVWNARNKHGDQE
jgi:hypothetical protein